ncbi:MAG: NusA N-terminal domain-containing protein [Oscillospiraceae bacterium]
MMEKIVQALVTAYKRDHEDVENVVVDVNEEKRDLKMFVEKTVVEEVENPAAEISAEEAKAISAKYHVGDTVRFPVKNVDFGRIAAGNSKQVIIQGLREAEHGMIYDEYNSKQHEILTGTVVRVDPRPAMPRVRLGTGCRCLRRGAAAGRAGQRRGVLRGSEAEGVPGGGPPGYPGAPDAHFPDPSGAGEAAV